jgi:uncharacterized OB-fold protein
VTRPQRPVPVADEGSAPYWAAAAEGLLVVARCSRCRAFAHPPDLTCPHCRHTDPAFVFERVSGRGVVRTWTVVRQSFLGGFEDDLPFVLVDVELEEQPDLRIVGRLVDGPEAALHLGDPVVVSFEQVAPGVAVPSFALAGDR